MTVPSSGTARANQAAEYLQMEVNDAGTDQGSIFQYLPSKSTELQNPLRTDGTRDEVQELSLGS